MVVGRENLGGDDVIFVVENQTGETRRLERNLKGIMQPFYALFNLFSPPPFQVPN